MDRSAGRESRHANGTDGRRVPRRKWRLPTDLASPGRGSANANPGAASPAPRMERERRGAGGRPSAPGVPPREWTGEESGGRSSPAPRMERSSSSSVESRVANGPGSRGAVESRAANGTGGRSRAGESRAANGPGPAPHPGSRPPRPRPFPGGTRVRSRRGRRLPFRAGTPGRPPPRPRPWALRPPGRLPFPGWDSTRLALPMCLSAAGCCPENSPQKFPKKYRKIIIRGPCHTLCDTRATGARRHGSRRRVCRQCVNVSTCRHVDGVVVSSAVWGCPPPQPPRPPQPEASGAPEAPDTARRW